MEDQLISFETAKLAKEKGYDFENTWEYIDKMFRYKHDMTRFLITQSLLQKWLREKHNIIITPKTDFIAWECVVDHPDWTEELLVDKIRTEKEPLGVFYYYEEALEAGLQKALTLI
jgi:hypothetical protein